jgi:beta-lactamase class A
MKRAVIILLLAALFAFPASVSARSSEDLMVRAQQLKALFSADPQQLESVFTEAFIAEAQPAKVFAEYYADLGPCRKVVPQRDGVVAFYFERAKIPADIRLDSRPPHKITGLWLGNALPLAKGYGDVVEKLESMPAVASFYVKQVGKAEPIAQYNAEAQLAIASVSKLYLLGALIDSIDAKQRRWSDVVSLDPKRKSLPSGILQDWPGSAPITLHSLASLMISRSDNTATDHLLSLLGRDQVERQLVKMKHARPERNTPFLSTAELFKLKEASRRRPIAEYLGKSPSEKRQYLDKALTGVSLADISEHEEPQQIETLEWFASAKDLCHAMEWLHAKGAMAQSLLAINPGLDPFARYAGYKGGSEPGVYGMAYLLRGADGAVYTAAMIWNDSKQPIDEKAFNRLMAQVLELI